jgi:hypothetical protein
MPVVDSKFVPVVASIVESKFVAMPTTLVLATTSIIHPIAAIAVA